MAQTNLIETTVAQAETHSSALNPAQQDAVTHTTGPLLVVAGAGTGKTKTLTHRIAWLIQEQLAKPSEILALTFTEKAAGEMETRVDQLLPYGCTDTVISTFHAFGDQLLREHALDVGLPPEFRVLGSTEQQLFLEERFDQIEGLQELRPVASPRKHVQAILSTISRAKDELVTPEQYLEIAKKLIASSQDEIEKREAIRQRDIALVYAAYEQFKAEKGVIDFGDQLLKLLEFLDAQPKQLQLLQNKFKYVLVDEFQDTNIAQYTLVKKLVEHHKNLTVVGDDDQAIYKFRGAAVSNILGFLKDFPKAKTVVLTENYRSTQAILDAAYSLIQHNNPDRLEERLSIDKRLHGQQKGKRPTFRWYKHEADELKDLADAVKRRVVTTPANEVAILVRTNSQVGAIAKQLALADVPYRTSSDNEFLAKPEIRGVIAFLTALAHPDDSLSYMKLALSPFYEIDPAHILPFNDAARRANRTLSQVLDDESSVAWGRVEEKGKDSLRNLRNDLARYRTLIDSKNPGEILYQFLTDRGVLRAFSAGTGKQTNLLVETPDERKLEMVQNIAAVFDAIQGYLVAGRDSFALAFVDQLEELLATVTPPSTNQGPEQEAVSIMTSHASKGLEFDTVFLPGMTADKFPARPHHDPLPLPSALIAESLPSGNEHLEEERRLAYVAMTRARTFLVLSAAQTSGQAKRQKKISPFVMEALELNTLPQAQEIVGPADRIASFATQTPAPITAQFPVHDGVISLTPAMIESYTNDPYDFYWKYVLKAPQAPSAHLNYGNAIHAAIEAFNKARIRGELLSIDAVLQRYAEAWAGQGFASKEEENRRFEAGQETLRRFVVRASTEPAPTAVEDSFSFALPNNIRIRGRIDALYDANIGEIRDYKTSQVKDQKDADAKARKNLPIRIYALAYFLRTGKPPKKVTLDFVEADLTASIVPDDVMIESIRGVIAEAAEGIKAGLFPPNPNNPFKDYE